MAKRKIKSKLKKVSIILVILILAFFYWLNYKTSADPDFATYSRGFKTESVSAYELVNGIFDDGLKRMDEYAKLSHIVYRDKGYEEITTFKNWKQLLIPMENIEPEDKDRKVLEGLHYELWELNETDETIVAIVFRGTNAASDWWANIRWFRRIVDRTTWDHYHQLHKISQSIVDSIKSKHSQTKNLKIVSAGHSLGGGLAQFMAYSIPEINYVYAFNPSPVTGYYDVKPRSKRNENKKDAMIYRIYESGEALSFARKLMTILYPVPLFKTKDPALIRIRFSFSTGDDPLSQHGMNVLAKNLSNYQRDRDFKLPDK